MLLNFEPFHRSKNSSEGKKDYFLTRVTTAKKIKTCCECLFTIHENEEHHQAVGFWMNSDGYIDERTCLRCHELLIALDETPMCLGSMKDFHFGSLHKRVKALKERHPNDFETFTSNFDLSDITKRIEKKKGWRRVPMQVSTKMLSSKDYFYCCQCSWLMPPKTRYEQSTITENHQVYAIYKTCPDCVEKRKTLEPYLADKDNEHQLLHIYQRDSIGNSLRHLSTPEAIATITDPQVLKLVNDFIAANRRFEYEAEEEFEEEIERRQSGFIPPTTPYEFKLKAALEKAGYVVIHNVPLGYYFPDLLIESCKCILEVDGLYHATDYQQAKDAYRTEYLNSRGYFVVRVSNSRIRSDLRAVMAEIKQAIANKENINLG